jgi:hypothetical protein
MLHILLKGQIIETKVVGYQTSDIRYALLEVAGSVDD